MLIYKGEVCEGRRADERVRANEAERGLSSESRQRAVGNLCVCGFPSVCNMDESEAAWRSPMDLLSAC